MSADQAVAFKRLLPLWDKMRVDDASPYDLLAISPAKAARIGDGQLRAPVSLAFRAARVLGQLMALDAVDTQIRPMHRGHIYDAVSALGSRAVAYYESGRRMLSCGGPAKRPDGEIGRREGLKIPFAVGGGLSPLPRHRW
jgi:hypothetical protein